jgi:hypothetical protein
MKTLPMSPAAIKELGNIIVKTAMEQVAKEAGVTHEQLLVLMAEDKRVSKRVQDYIVSGYNFAKSKI